MPFLLEDSWEIGNEAGDQMQRIIEFVRPGQNVANWTEMFTAQTFNKQSGWWSLDEMLEGHRNELTTRCPGSTVVVIRRDADSVLFESNITNCPDGPDEQVIVRILDASANRFWISYATRAPVVMTPSRRVEWIEKLSEAFVMAMP